MKTDFIRIIINNSDESETVRYVNQNHIQQIFEKKGKIVIELASYDTIEITGYTLDSFMERFIKS
jgi:flagellar motor protein MotB